MPQEPMLIFNTPMALDLSANSSSRVIDLSSVPSFSVHHVYSAGATGNIITEVSNDGINFDTVHTHPLSGSAGNKMVPINQAPYAFARVSYAKTSGSGSLTSTMAGKLVS
jgi:hypothetical protein